MEACLDEFKYRKGLVYVDSGKHESSINLRFIFNSMSVRFCLNQKEEDLIYPFHSTHQKKKIPMFALR